MTKRIEITPEMVKLAQQRTRLTGGDIREEIARRVAQEAVLALDPGCGFLLDEESAYSKDDCLVAAFAVNDIVVNASGFDVRIADQDDYVSVPRYLVGTAYMKNGTLVVSMGPDRSAGVVSFIPLSEWEWQDKQADLSLGKLSVKVKDQEDLALVLSGGKASDKTTKSSSIPSRDELSKFLADRSKMTIKEQKEIVEAVLCNPGCWEDLSYALSLWSKRSIKHTLNHASVWNSKLEKLCGIIQPKFNKLSKEDIKRIAASLGEQLGGQIESPRFRHELLLCLVKEELSYKLKGEQLKKASAVVQQVVSGNSVMESVKAFIKNSVACDIAKAIKDKRQKVTSFIEASAEELSFAFQQLTLQPVYATHSQDTAGVDSINEALCLLDACDLVENVKFLEKELAAL